MDSLRDGVRVHLDEAALAVPGRIELSEGTVGASDVGLGAFYLPGAHIPAEPFRAPTDAELSRLLADRDACPDWSRTAHLTRIPPQLLEILKPLSLEARTDMSACCAVYAADFFQPALDAFVAAIVRRHARRVDRVHSLGLTFHPPGLPTVSSDVPDPGRPAPRKRLGLHVDDARLAPLSARELSPNRIAVNVGHQDRHLLFVNLTMSALRGLLAPAAIATSEEPERVATAFMRAFPAYPVTRLLLRPGEAYLAPTDNIIHDGATTLATAPSASVHVIGDFGLAGLSA